MEMKDKANGINFEVPIYLQTKLEQKNLCHILCFPF